MPPPNDPPRIGLCAGCRHAREIRSGRGSTFLRCGLSDEDSRYARYPAIPVLACAGFAPIASPPRERPVK